MRAQDIVIGERYAYGVMKHPNSWLEVVVVGRNGTFWQIKRSDRCAGAFDCRSVHLHLPWAEHCVNQQRVAARQAEQARTYQHANQQVNGACAALRAHFPHVDVRASGVNLLIPASSVPALLTALGLPALPDDTTE
jgi:hypothetical protein